MGSILLATDGREYARRAAAHAIDLAAERGVSLHVICVVDAPPVDDTTLSSAELATIYARDHAVMSVAEVSEMAAERDVVVEGED